MDAKERFLEQLYSTWGAVTLESFRTESDKNPDGGIWRAIRGPDGSRIAIMVCVTTPEMISLFEKTFLLIDDGETDDWSKATMLDLLMGTKDQGHGFAFQRDSSGKRTALIFVALTPESIASLERIFCLP